MVKPTVISTFAGCGGSSLGYKWAGFNELLAIEWETNAVKTFKLNFPKVPVWQKDIIKVSAKEILEFCNIKQGELDILDGSPPCQGFSTAGKRQVCDNRNDLSYEFIRLINGLQPKVFVMENVYGMVQGKMKGKFIEIMKALKETGYNVKCKLMNAMFYEVPQARKRLIWIGVKTGAAVYPEPFNKLITVKEALSNVNNEDWELKWTNYIKKSVIYERIIKMKMGESYKKYNPNGSGFSLSRNWLNRPSVIITKTVCHSASSDGTLHPIRHRKHTITEIKRLSSFPDTFQLIGTFQEQWARIGNAVMPKFMYHIAKTIKTEILN